MTQRERAERRAAPVPRRARQVASAAPLEWPVGARPRPAAPLAGGERVRPPVVTLPVPPNQPAGAEERQMVDGGPVQAYPFRQDVPRPDAAQLGGRVLPGVALRASHRLQPQAAAARWEPMALKAQPSLPLPLPVRAPGPAAVTVAAAPLVSSRPVGPSPRRLRELPSGRPLLETLQVSRPFPAPNGVGSPLVAARAPEPASLSKPASGRSAPAAGWAPPASGRPAWALLPPQAMKAPPTWDLRSHPSATSSGRSG